jgi:dTDP-4-dehydrorhamnose reductase
MQRVVVLGGSGMLGRAVRAELARRGIAHLAPGRADVDLAVPGSVERYLVPWRAEGTAAAAEGHPRWVINCAAFTDVEAAERDGELAHRVNGEAVGELARACAATGRVLLHFSAEDVFDGCGRTPFPPEAPRNPLNAYGKSKARGEELVEDSGADHLIVRTSGLYAPWGNNFLLAMRRRLREPELVRVIEDRWVRPSSVMSVARAALDLLRLGERGRLHVADGTICSWYEFARALHEGWDGLARLEPCSRAEPAEHPRPGQATTEQAGGGHAQRPAYGVLDISRTEALVGRAPSLGAALSEVLSHLADG